MLHGMCVCENYCASVFLPSHSGSNVMLQRPDWLPYVPKNQSPTTPVHSVSRHSWTAWPFKKGPCGCHETSVRHYIRRCVKCQKKADLICTEIVLFLQGISLAVQPLAWSLYLARCISSQRTTVSHLAGSTLQFCHPPVWHISAGDCSHRALNCLPGMKRVFLFWCCILTQLSDPR
jgi:hypothetical protein